MRARLTVNLTAIQKNWRFLKERASGAECSAVLKANAYGLGIEKISQALSKDVETFFVALPEEGITLRKFIPHKRIFILHGFSFKTFDDMINHNLIPILNTLYQIEQWQSLCKKKGKEYPAGLQVDSGMSRFGLSEMDLKKVVASNFKPILVISHLACADQIEADSNEKQYANFKCMTKYFTGIQKSLSASSGIFLDSKYHFDLVRPGAALYGIAPNNIFRNALLPALTLEVKILQLRTVNRGDSVGYGLTWRADQERRIATVGLGYADGFFRSNSDKKVFLWWKDIKLPIIGRISMDSLSIDVSSVPEKCLFEGMWLSVIGEHQSVDDIAEAIGTIGYEILVTLGQRFECVYINKD